MSYKKKRALRLTAAIVIALLTAGAGGTALADDISVSEYDAFDQGVALYEKLNNAGIEVPRQLIDEGYDEIFVKSVTLGFANLDDYSEELKSEYITNQDFINIIYKTIISCHLEFAMTEEETNEVLGEFANNAYLSDENRTAYAFALKTGVIGDDLDPNAELNWTQCAGIVDRAGNFFAGDETFTVNGREITIGSHISALTDTFGEPSRIDESDYGFDWYVYNEDYGSFFMAGVLGDRVCAFFSNGENFAYKDIKSGDDYAKAIDKVNDKISIYAGADSRVNGITYNDYKYEANSSASAAKAKSYEIFDMINAERSKEGKDLYALNDILNSRAFLAAAADEKPYTEDYICAVTGNSIFDIYCELINSENKVISNDGGRAIGISTMVEDDGSLEVNAVTNDRIVSGISAPVNEIKMKKTEKAEMLAPSEITTPVIISSENTYDGGEDVKIELAMQAALNYHIEVFDYESDEYIVNKYVTTDETEFVLPSDLFAKGRDYKIVLSAIDDNGAALSSDPLLISYGSEYNTGVKIISPYNAGITESDIINAQWESGIYSDFYVDLYNQNGELVVSKVVENQKSVSIKGLDPGNYYLYITALRKGTIVEKAQASAQFTVLQPKPVINEIILETDETYNFVYEDEKLGVLYFYDQELIDIEENGRTVTKKKIIQKQVKATKGYRELAKYISKPSFTTGSPFINSGEFTETGNAIVAEAEKYLGVPYVWGGTTPKGFDCSGLVKYVCQTLGIDVNRVAEDQFTNGAAISKDELMPGDLVFFENNGYIHHVGIYAGGGMMIHAPHTGDVVRYASLDDEYYKNEYAGARRVY